MSDHFMINDIVKVIGPGEGRSMAFKISKSLNTRYWKHGRYIDDTIALYKVISMKKINSFGDEVIVYIERLDGTPKGFLIGEKGLKLVSSGDFLKEEDFKL